MVEICHLWYGICSKFSLLLHCDFNHFQYRFSVRTALVNHIFSSLNSINSNSEISLLLKQCNKSVSFAIRWTSFVSSADPWAIAFCIKKNDEQKRIATRHRIRKLLVKKNRFWYKNVSRTKSNIEGNFKTSGSPNIPNFSRFWEAS